MPPSYSHAIMNLILQPMTVHYEVWSSPNMRIINVFDPDGHNG